MEDMSRSMEKFIESLERESAPYGICNYPTLELEALFARLRRSGQRVVHRENRAVFCARHHGFGILLGHFRTVA